MNFYKTISESSVGEYKEKGSRFIAYAFHVNDTNEIRERLLETKREHPKARHHCYAYRLGVDGLQYRAVDDGEPSGTAGKPILGQIDSFGLTNVLIVVVRYFGGVLLGASGLNHAYKSAAQLSLEAAQIIEKEITFGYRLTFNAEQLPEVMSLLKKNKIKSSSPIFNNGYSLEALIPNALQNDLVEQLKTLGVTTEAL